MSTHSTIDVQISLESPLLLGGRKLSGQCLESLDYIPGRVIRGALATSLLESRAHEPVPCRDGCDFCDLLLKSGAAIFRNAYPCGKESTGSTPARMTQVRCKTRDDHPSFDTLTNRMVASLKGTLYEPRCPTCSDRVERRGGYLTDNGKKNPAHARMETVRVGIDRGRRTAAEEFLYSLSVHSEFDEDQEKTQFRGTIRCPSRLARDVARILEERLHRLGGATSRGLGAVSVMAKVQDKKNQDLVAQRVKRWNAHLASALQAEGRKAILPVAPHLARLATESTPDRLRGGKAGYFVIDLLSDAVFAEYTRVGDSLVSTGRQDFVLGVEALARQTGCSAPAQLVTSFASPTYRAGWNATWGLPRPVDLLSVAGGVFVYWTDDLPAWVTSIEKLEEIGAGERVEEGLGHVEICSTIHLENRIHDTEKGAPRK